MSKRILTQSLFDDPKKREELMHLLGKAGGITAIGHGLKLDEPVNSGSLTWATSAFDCLYRLALLAGTADGD